MRICGNHRVNRRAMSRSFLGRNGNGGSRNFGSCDCGRRYHGRCSSHWSRRRRNGSNRRRNRLNRNCRRNHGGYWLSNMRLDFMGRWGHGRFDHHSDRGRRYRNGSMRGCRNSWPRSRNRTCRSLGNDGMSRRMGGNGRMNRGNNNDGRRLPGLRNDLTRCRLDRHMSRRRMRGRRNSHDWVR